MKEKFIIPYHSFIDLITNSSTELFIINEELLSGEVLDICQRLFRHYRNDTNWDPDQIEAYIFNQHEDDHIWAKNELEYTGLPLDKKYLVFRVEYHMEEIRDLIREHFKPIISQCE